MVLASPGVLPGIRFEPQPPPPDAVLPRMDIAAFVGLAERGPLDVPVAVNDLAGYTATFGGDLVLGTDAGGAEVTANLRPAVAAFFRNGGRRCWVVRVAGPQPRRLAFDIPGVLRIDPEQPAPGRAALGRVQASSAGRWAAGLTVGAALDAVDLALTDAVRAAAEAAPAEAGPDGEQPTAQWRLRVARAADVVPGDVLRIALGSGRTAYVVAGDGAATGPGSWVSVRDVAAFGAVVAASGLDAPAQADGVATWRADGVDVACPAAVPQEDGGRRFEVEIALGGAPAPVPGTWLRLHILGAPWRVRAWWVQCRRLRVMPDSGGSVRVVGPAFAELAGAAALLDERLMEAMARHGLHEVRVERLRLTLLAGRGAARESIPDLGLAPGHPRFVGSLPLDEERNAGAGHAAQWPGASVGGQGAVAPPAALAGTQEPGFLVPLAVHEVPDAYLGPVDAAGDADDLASVSTDDFVDPALARVEPARLLGEADYIRYGAPVPRTLRGIHALLAIDEVTLVAAPDAALRAWTPVDSTPIGGPRPPRTPLPDPEPFAACDPGAPATPEPRITWLAQDRPRLAWPVVPGAEHYVVEWVSGPPSWAPPVSVERRCPRFVPQRPADGTHRFRVRAVGLHGSSAWSRWIGVEVRSTPARRLASGDLGSVATFHRALLGMCAARGDLFAILSLPADTSPSDALDHVMSLRDTIAPSGPAGGRRVPAPDADPLGVLSFGALYHPWVVAVADPASVGIRRGIEALPLGAPATTATAATAPTATGTLAARPPDGAIAGIHASRSATRGAWVAAANVALRDIVAIDRPVRDDDLAGLHLAGVNVVRRTPAGFLVLAAHTLSEDRLLRMANVRRLLALLRRLALLRGADYVFEPNDAAFRRRIERGFDAILASLFERGAFAGARASDAYRVTVGDPPNTRQSVDAGRLIVELRVAPSVPLEFLTVRMVRSGDRFTVEAA